MFAQARRIAHPDGARTELLDLHSPGRPTLTFGINIAAHSELELITSATVPSAFLLFGGPVAAIVRDGVVEQTMTLGRQPWMRNFWITKTFVVGERLLVAHEEELLLIDADLSIAWRASKSIQDLVEEVTMEGVRIDNEREGESWFLFDRARPEWKASSLLPPKTDEPGDT